jgi:predicted GNAT family acetyltransferase
VLLDHFLRPCSYLGDRIWPIRRHDASGLAMKFTWRYANDTDLGQLADWNHQLIRDEGHRNRMTVPELEDRMRGWLREKYRAVIFSADGVPVAYALFCLEPDLVYLRQYFVARTERRQGYGKAGMAILRSEIWPQNVRLVLDVLCGNATAIAFYRALGFKDYCLTLEVFPEKEGNPGAGC